MKYDELYQFIRLFQLESSINVFKSSDEDMFIITPMYKCNDIEYQGKPVTIHRYEIKTGLTKLHRMIYKLVDNVLFTQHGNNRIDDVVQNRTNRYTFECYFAKMNLIDLHHTIDKYGNLYYRVDVYQDDVYQELMKSITIN